MPPRAVPPISSLLRACVTHPTVRPRLHPRRTVLSSSCRACPFAALPLRSPTPHRTATSSAVTMAPIPKTMSGILIEEPGGVDVLKWRTDLPVPELKEGEVLVKNEYIGVNYIDTYFRTGLYKAPLPLITGREAAGVVAATHASETRLSPGDRVAYFGDHTYAELTAVPSARLLRLPQGLEAERAAAALLQGLTALTLIREAAGIGRHLGVSEGPWVLVHAAAGGVGSQLVQMLAARGVKVIGSAGSAEKCALARRRGAQWVVNSREEDIVARVKEITFDHGVDVIFDGVGKATFEADLEMVARKGSVIMFGNASGAVPPVDLLKLGAKNIKLLRPVLFNYLVTREELENYANELFGLLQSGKIVVDVHKVYPLKDVAQAHSDLEGRKTTGKLLLKP